MTTYNKYGLLMDDYDDSYYSPLSKPVEYKYSSSGNYVYGPGLIPTYNYNKKIKGWELPDQIEIYYSKMKMQYDVVIVIALNNDDYKDHIALPDVYMYSDDPFVLINFMQNAVEKLFNNAYNYFFKKDFKTKFLATGGPLETFEYPTNPAADVIPIKKSKNVYSLQGGVVELIGTDAKGDKSMMKVKVPCPEDTCTYGQVLGQDGPTYTTDAYTMVMHLNDDHQWPRETAIADWLDKLADDGIIDITIEIPDTPMEAE
jgi:hypothetical protein